MSLTPHQKEFKIHCAIVEDIPKRFPGLFFFHIPNRPGSGKDGAFKKRMGAKAGAFDIVASWPVEYSIMNKILEFLRINFFRVCHVGGMEIKIPGEKLETVQNKFHSTAHFVGWYTGLSHGVGEYIKLFKSWGLKPKYEEFVEPDLSSWDEKLQQAFEVFAPYDPS